MIKGLTGCHEEEGLCMSCMTLRERIRAKEGKWLNVGKSFLTVTRSAEVDWTASRLRAVQPFAMMLLILAGHLS